MKHLKMVFFTVFFFVLFLGISNAADYTIWPSSAVPEIIDNGPDAPVELGVKFRSDTDGYITGIRFYKASANVGPHVGTLWSNDGTLLASAPFTNETESGWQQVNFATPVAITANTIYRASYHCPTGHFSVTRNYFSGQSIDSGPLHAPADGMFGGNGVARYGGPGSFPDTTWFASNYWVDVVFQPSTSADRTIWPSSAVPQIIDNGPDAPVELGVKFKSDVDGYITGIRFYKASANVGPHVVNLWSNDGTLLASAPASPPFANETESGWQQVNFAAAVPITANTIYRASYHSPTGHFSVTRYYFSGQSADNAPLHAPADGMYGGNGVATYGETSVFPDSTWFASNYWVDVVFQPSPSGLTIWPSSAVPEVTNAQFSIPIDCCAHETGVKFQSDVEGYITGIRFYKSSMDTVIESLSLWSYAERQLLARAYFPALTGSGWQQVNLATPVRIAANTPYVASVHSLTAYYSKTDNYFPNSAADNPPLHASAGGFTSTLMWSTFPFPSPFPTTTNYWVDVVFLPSSISEHSIWPNSAIPAERDAGPDAPVELGIKFMSEKNGYITGIKFYKLNTNSGTHVGNLWSNDGTLLASATFTNETEIGWQRVNFATPVRITANTIYRASYHCPNGHFSVDRNYFSGQSIHNPPLHAPADGMYGGNGVATYGETSVFPDYTWSASNYWVDVIFVEE